MAGPWERYSAPQTPAESGPWSQFNAPEETGRGGGFLPYIYRGAASVLGAPVDIVNFALSKAGLPVSQEPIGGSASLESLLAKYGSAIGAPMVPEAGQEPETGPEYIGRGVGEAVGSLIPGFGAARLAAASANPVVAGVGRTIANAPVAAPVSTLAGELASGAGAGAGRYMAEQSAPDSEIAGTIGELVGGFTPSLATLAAKYGPTGMGYRVVRAGMTPFTETGAGIRAGRRLQSLVADKDIAARAAETPTISELTPAQRTEDVRLLSLEKAVAQADPAKAKELADRAATAQETLCVKPAH